MKNKKIAVAVAAAMLIGVLAVVSYIVRPAMAPNTQTQSDLPKNPPVIGTLVTASDTGVTIGLQDGKQQTFAVSTSTKVVTQVTSTEAGKALPEITPGTAVLVQPHVLHSTVADMISVVPVPIADNDPRGPLVTVSGTIVGTTTGTITVNTAGDPQMKIALTKDTVFLSNVLAGQKGKGPADMQKNMFVQVAGIATTKGLEAKSIQLLVPLVQ